jgi:hypothetical protein
MKIKAIKDFHGSLNGFEVIFIEKNTVLDVDEVTAKNFLEAGFCEPVTKEKTSQQNAN